MEDLGGQAGVKLPKGASLAVKTAAMEIAKKSGAEGLKAVSKFHFKTFREVIEGRDASASE